MFYRVVTFCLVLRDKQERRRKKERHLATLLLALLQWHRAAKAKCGRLGRESPATLGAEGSNCFSPDCSQSLFQSIPCIIQNERISPYSCFIFKNNSQITAKSIVKENRSPVTNSVLSETLLE